MKSILLLSILTAIPQACMTESQKNEVIAEEIKAEETENEILELNDKVSNLDEDLFIAYSGLQRIDSLLDSGDVEGARQLTRTTLADLGEFRFLVSKEAKIATDIVTGHMIDTDMIYSEIGKNSRQFAYQLAIIQYSKYINTQNRQTYHREE